MNNITEFRKSITLKMFLKKQTTKVSFFTALILAIAMYFYYPMNLETKIQDLKFINIEMTETYDANLNPLYSQQGYNQDQLEIIPDLKKYCEYRDVPTCQSKLDEVNEIHSKLELSDLVRNNLIQKPLLAFIVFYSVFLYLRFGFWCALTLGFSRIISRLFRKIFSRKSKK
ncbi:hypothetical protein L7E35_004644 [Vibrio parahaemolyticus]|nr:hypothetical protein [Vibrio parahaemolyticus]EIV1599698.1 hypothetical protein [Vibrio parahaemolyticus]